MKVLTNERAIWLVKFTFETEGGAWKTESCYTDKVRENDISDFLVEQGYTEFNILEYSKA